MASTKDWQMEKWNMCWLLRQELAPNTLLTFIVGLVNYIPHKGKYVVVELGEDPHPNYLPCTPPLLWPSFSRVLRLLTIPPESVCHLFANSSSHSCVWYLWLFKPTLSVFPSSPHSNIPNFTHSLSLPFSIQTLYFYVVISTLLRYLPSFFCPQLCYFLLCMEDTFRLWLLGKWWLH